MKLRSFTRAVQLFCTFKVLPIIVYNFWHEFSIFDERLLNSIVGVEGGKVQLLMSSTLLELYGGPMKSWTCFSK